ncbi:MULTISPECIES: ATP-grasp domain-containing protein [unclassified Caulobacter]|uniref:ATP-grasp domain-containing protein n=1 Tax=unclassified Caulobacter TaxID=2648921 RepID=UPI000D3BF51E|nr:MULTISPECIES: transporter [unclassified Caulobacter]PTS82981.1 transporter [Caulobacter sp. HMWF009]PTT11968.1 transporter [Caulobacter sp. HMWF025]PTT78333.1 transporter [Pseudomonas sp. HMWF010]
MTDILILAPAADEPRFATGWDPLFQRLARPLRARGLTVEAQAWTEPVAADRAQLVMPSIAWGYHLRQADWFAQLDAWEADEVPVLNPVPTLRWNTTKTYLVELEGKGAPVVPTHAHDRLTEEALLAAFDAFGVDELVVKPQISGGSQDTVRVRRHAALEGGPSGPALIQPFLPAVGEEGELSLFYFDGVFSHAVAKVAARGDFRVQPQFGGQVSGVAPEPEALRAAQMVLEAADRPLTYARIDLIRGLDHTPQLMELEVIEPDLFLEHAHDHGAAFAAAVAARL